MTASNPHPTTDAEIIRRVRDGDARAYALLIDRHKERGMALAFRMLRNREEAEEALQDAFVRAFKALPNFEEKSTFSTWLYRIVFNVCSTKLSRKRDIHDRGSDSDEEIIIAREDPDPLPDAVLESSQSDAIIREEIEKLPEAYGTTFTLFAVHEKSYDEIVEITGVALGTVKARLFRARALLRDAVAHRLGVSVEEDRKRKEQAA